VMCGGRVEIMEMRLWSLEKQFSAGSGVGRIPVGTTLTERHELSILNTHIYEMANLIGYCKANMFLDLCFGDIIRSNANVVIGDWKQCI